MVRAERASRWAVALLLATLAWPVARASAQQGDALFAQVQQLVNAGNRIGARALADSALTVRTPGTMAYGEALYARAYASSDAGAAERDYLRVSIEYPFSPRAEDAMYMVGQFRQSRGDRAGARSQYERITREFPTGTHVARAAYWAGQLALEDGDLAAGCQLLFVASERVSRDDVELRNQVEYQRNRCMMPTSPASPPRDSVAADTTASSSPPRPPPSAEPAREYSVQVAAFARKRDAEALSSRLKARGFQVRVVGVRAPYRVRVGRYPTRDEAVAAQGRMKRSRVNGIVVEAEAR
ncbi:MAG: SPOR domain-containing protein [Gemmatimonadaceae bacterium]|nr:SPOR domain-containing protein [Gemmatimonadaceae bacterium]